jgi:surface protein
MAKTIKSVRAGGKVVQIDYEALANKPTVDIEMSSSSTNSVQNKVIKEYVDTANMYPIAYKTNDGYGTVSAYTSDGNYSIIALNSLAGICWISRDCNKLSFSTEFIALDFSRADTRNITNTSMLCAPALTSLDLSYFDTSNVTDMSYMFSWKSPYGRPAASNLSIIGASSSFADMLEGCYNLESLDVSNFDTSKVTNMKGMFYNCSSLWTLDLSFFDTSNVTDMSNMFEECCSLSALDLYSFDTSTVTDMSYMFSQCYGLSSLDLSYFNTSKVTDMSYMFNYCNGLTSLNLSGWNTSKVTNMSYMFNNCTVLSALDLSSFDTSNVTDMSHMFDFCVSLSVLDLSSFDTTNVKNIYRMFYATDDRNKISKLTLSSSFFNSTAVTTYNFCYLKYWTDADSLANLVSVLPTITTSKTLQLSNQTVSAMTEEQKTTITAKGWTISLAGTTI